MITVTGLVVSERVAGESDKYITVFTETHGTIDITVKGANKITGRNHATTQLFTYSKFCINESRKRFYLDSSELIRDFYDLRLDIKKLSLACYFAEIVKFTATISDTQREKNIMRLLLNSLHLLCGSKHSCEFVKAVFELRFMCEIGFMPEVIGCHYCYDFSAEKYYFILNKGYFVCMKDFYENDSTDNSTRISVGQSHLKTMQFICLSDMEKLFSFKISEQLQSQLSNITESYLRYHLSSDFKTLRYYKSV